MKKIFLAVLGLVVIAANPAFAQYGYGYGRGMGTASWLGMAFFGLISFIIGSFIFSWIFWMVGENIIEKRWMEIKKLKDGIKEEAKAEARTQTPGQC